MDNSVLTVSHIISVQELKLSDHIYHQYNTMWWTRHGIITYIPSEEKNRTLDEIKVVTITIRDNYNDIEEISLRKFLDGRKLRRVYYNVSAWYESMHVEGTCHRQIKSKPTTIIERCNAIKEEFQSINNDFFSTDSLNRIVLKQLTDNNFGFWCCTGIVHSNITNTRIGAMLEAIEDKRLGIDVLNAECSDNNIEEANEEKKSPLIDLSIFEIKDIVSINDLKVSDHIYRYQLSYNYQHHGIVYYIPSEETQCNEDNIKVIEMNKEHKVNIISLREFLKGQKLRRATYNVSEQYQISHVKGNCYVEPKDEPNEIIKRCNYAIKESTMMEFAGMDNKVFAIYCMTGNVHSVDGQTQIIESCVQSAGHTSIYGIMKAVEKSVAKAASKVINVSGTEIAETAASKAINVSGKASAAGTTGAEIITEGAKRGVSSFAVASLVGVSVAVESIATGWRIYKYKNSVDILWDDTKMAIIQGWTGTGCSIAAGLICLVTGVAAWPAFVVSAGVGLLCWIGFKIYNHYHGKSSKEKLFNERGLKLNSSIREKQAEIRLINKEIKDKKLHPDKFKDDLPQKFVKIYEFDMKQHPLDITIKSDENEKYAIIDKVEMSEWNQWIKGIRSGMVVYSINNCIVYNDHNTFDEIKEIFDECLCNYSSDTIQFGLFKMKNVENEIKTRIKTFHWLKKLKEVIEIDIYECRTNKKGKNKLKKQNKKQSAPLPITWNQ